MEPWLTPLYDAAAMRATDAWAIDERGMPSLELMEAAGAAVADAVAEVAGTGPVRVVCGKGNNGGDGLVAARLLAGTGHQVEALLLWPAGELSPDAAASLARLDGGVQDVDAGRVEAAIAGSGAVVDAIFGTGFDGAPRDPAAAAIAAINACPAPVVAADVASGVDASTGEIEGAAVGADLTVTFHAPKLGHWVAPGKDRAGEVRVAAIGIPSGAPAPDAAGLIGADVLRKAPARAAGSTKFSSGQVVVVGGSAGLTGAVCLSAEAAIRAGAGYATVAVPAELESIFEIKLTEVMSRAIPGSGARLGGEGGLDATLVACERADAVVLGPGLGRAGDSLELARELAVRVEAPLVLDADGLNAFAGRLGHLRKRRAATVVTPHAGELGRLLERDSEEISARRLASAREAAGLAGAIVVLKGDDTIVAEGERVAVSRGGAAALATAGTGDVLSGVIGALLARGMEPFAATCAGVEAQQAAGRAASRRIGLTEAVIATDVIESLPEAMR